MNLQEREEINIQGVASHSWQTSATLSNTALRGSMRGTLSRHGDMDKTHHREERPAHASAQLRTGLIKHLLLWQPAKSTPQNQPLKAPPQNHLPPHQQRANSRASTEAAFHHNCILKIKSLSV